jgi:hypothetical protein
MRGLAFIIAYVALLLSVPLALRERDLVTLYMWVILPPQIFVVVIIFKAARSFRRKPPSSTPGNGDAINQAPSSDNDQQRSRFPRDLSLGVIDT